MATSRTGTAHWKALRSRVLQDAIDAGQYTCPLCHVAFDLTRSKQPNSPEVDHIKADALGGASTEENLRVICRQCNQKLGGKTGAAKRHALIKARRSAETIRPKTSLKL